MSMELNSIFSKYLKPVAIECPKVNAELCKGCGGLCCKSLGCHFSPFDFKEITVESIINFINESQCVSIDWWEGNPLTNEHDNSRCYFLRIKNRNSKVIDPSFGGVCSILTDNGCPLFFEYRPKGARELIPCEGDCLDGYCKQQAAIEWFQYQDVMKKVYDYYFEKGDVVNSPLMLMSLFDELLTDIIKKHE